MKVRFIRMNQKWANNRIKAAAGMLGDCLDTLDWFFALRF